MGISITPMGIQQAAAALRNIERRQEVVANNLANVSTPGFKGEKVFHRLLEGVEVAVLDAATDRSQGALQQTGAALDLALEHDGFFVVETAEGEQLTRGGSWRLNSDGYLVDPQGARVLGEYDPRGGDREPVRIPLDASTIRIERDGSVIVDGAQLARLRVESVPQETRLEHVGEGRFLAPVTRASIPIEERAVRQGALEDSNVGSVDSLVELIEIQRAYANVQKAITTIDAARGIIVSDVARPL